MKAEDWNLFKRDLCTRLPHGVKVSILGSGPMELKSIVNSTIGWFAIIDGAPTDFSIDEIRPYLRPMSSMTEEEKGECCSIFNNIIYQFEVNEYGDVESTKPTVERECIYYDAQLMAEWMNWLNKHHFDYRGLIEKGLALEAPEGMYK